MPLYHNSGLVAGWRWVIAATVFRLAEYRLMDTAQLSGRGGRQVGCITCVVEWYNPKYGTPHCSGGNLAAIGRKATRLDVRIRSIPRCQPLAGAEVALGQRRYIVPYIG